MPRPTLYEDILTALKASTKQPCIHCEETIGLLQNFSFYLGMADLLRQSEDKVMYDLLHLMSQLHKAGYDAGLKHNEVEELTRMMGENKPNG